ncbi:MAG: DUF1028 domain-containing protein [Gemmatimonadetes bacterium]|nr:DUF1028 domain-containing protein [Gemmatimonadota bacterium]
MERWLRQERRAKRNTGCGCVRVAVFVLLVSAFAGAGVASAQEGEDGVTGDPVLHTFSIVAIDPATGEAGLAVTTRNPCVGNRLYWVRRGVGAAASQANLRIKYGPDILAGLERGLAPEQAMREAMKADPDTALRQIGVIDLKGRVVQYTGSRTSPWAGHRAGPNYATQGNLLTGPEVLDAVSTSFESTEGSGRHLADRLIEAIQAGHALGGDFRHGRQQSAAVYVADPRPGVPLRPDGITVNISVCEHADPVAELRRVYDAVSQTLGYRTLQEFEGRDVLQLRIILHALGYLDRPLSQNREAGDAVYDQEVMEAVDRFRRERGMSTGDVGAPPGLVDRELVDALWAALADAGKEKEVRDAIRDLVLAFRPGS